MAYFKLVNFVCRLFHGVTGKNTFSVMSTE